MMTKKKGKSKPGSININISLDDIVAFLGKVNNKLNKNSISPNAILGFTIILLFISFISDLPDFMRIAGVIFAGIFIILYFASCGFQIPCKKHVIDEPVHSHAQELTEDIKIGIVKRIFYFILSRIICPRDLGFSAGVFIQFFVYNILGKSVRIDLELFYWQLSEYRFLVSVAIFVVPNLVSGIIRRWTGKNNHNKKINRELFFLGFFNSLIVTPIYFEFNRFNSNEFHEYIQIVLIKINNLFS